MTEIKETNNSKPEQKPARKSGSASSGGFGKKKFGRREEKQESDFDQAIIDIARVTRVMAGGKRMRFRACVALGNKAGKIGLGLAKGADVSLAITKAVSKAKKKMINVPICNGTIPHKTLVKFGAAKVLLKPGKAGSGIICGGVVRSVVELAGIHNITSKILGTNNKVANAKCVIKALSEMKTLKEKKIKVEVEKEEKKDEDKKEVDLSAN